MKPLNTLNSVIDQIYFKLDSHNVDFDEFEIEVLKTNKKLMNKMVELLSIDFEVWQTVSSETENLLIIMQANYELNKNFHYNYNKYLIDNNKLNIMLENNFLDKNQIKELFDYVRSKLKDPNYQFEKSSVSQDILNLIVEENRMDLLSNIKYISNIDNDTMLIIGNYFANSKELLPPAFYSYLKSFNIPIENLDINALIRAIHKKELEITDDIFNLIITKLEDCQNFIKNDDYWSNIFKRLNDSQKSCLSDLLFNRNSYLNSISYLNITPDNYEQYINRFINIIELGDISNDYVERFSQDKNSLIILSDPRVMESLIKNKYILIALYSPIVSKYVSSIIEVINSDPLHFKNMSFKDYSNLYEYAELLKELIKIGNRSVCEMAICSSSLKQYYKEQLLSGNFDLIPSDLMNDDDFINQMILNGNIDIVFSTNNKFRRINHFIFNDQNCENIINKCLEDLEFALYFISANSLTVVRNEKLLLFALQAHESFIDLLVERINHLEKGEKIYSNRVFDLTKNYFVKKYNLNELQFVKLEQHFGPELIRYLENDNIKKIINLDEETFNKILSLFPKLEFTMVDVEKIYDALKQFEFSKKNIFDVEIFATLYHSILDNNPDYLEHLNKILSIFNSLEEKEKFYKKFSNTYPNLSENVKYNLNEFLLMVVNYIQNGSVNEKNYYTEVLHFITDYYIAHKREKYRDSYDLYNDLDLPYNLDDKDSVKQFIKHAAIGIHKNLIILEMQEKGVKEDLAIDCINYYAYDKRDFSDERQLEIKKHIKLMIDIVNKIIKLTGISPYILDTLDNENKIRRKYYVEANENNQYSILMNLRIDVLKNTIFKPENNDIYQSLLTYIYKYKLHLLPNYFKKVMAGEHIDISFEVDDVACFMSYYQQIYDTERKRLDSVGKSDEELNLGIISIMKYAEAYSSISSVFSQILGPEDVRLIKSNPKPNAAIYRTQGDTRLKEAVMHTLDNFKRNEVTVPTFNKIIEVDGKNIRVSVGNFTHPGNMTMGERTGSCMRIGGQGETLFNFILENTNGFNIRFEDPETGEFISRVSGFRNGNSVFLNELRYSCNPDKYRNADIVNFCVKVSNMLIAYSKDSTYPIENVFLHNDYATKGLGLIEIPLNITDCREGLGRFYTDIKDKGIVLATTKKPFVPIDFNKANIPTYFPAREEAYAANDSNRLRAMINRVHAIRYALAGFNYEYIEPLKFDSGIRYGIVNQDWYIYIDQKGEIYEELISFDSRAMEELEEARNRIYQMKNSEEQSIKIGG